MCFDVLNFIVFVFPSTVVQSLAKCGMQLGKLRANIHVINLTTQTVAVTSVYFNHPTLLLARQQ